MGGALCKGLASMLLGHGGWEEEKQWCVCKRLLEDADGSELDGGTRSAVLMPFYQMLGPLLLGGFPVGRLQMLTVLQGCTHASSMKSFILCLFGARQGPAIRRDLWFSFTKCPTTDICVLYVHTYVNQSV